MLRSCSEECAKTLLLKARPQVTLQKEDLLVPGQLCTDVYILITGSLQITLPSQDDAGVDDPGRPMQKRDEFGWMMQAMLVSTQN